MGKSIVEFKNVTKEFKIHRSNKDRFIDMVFLKDRGVSRMGVSEMGFTVEKGESVAVIGKIGSGKSVICSMIAGITSPTRGRVKVDGKVSYLSGDLRNGFVGDFTGRKNMKIQAALLGWSDSMLKEHEQEIVDFTELGDAIDKPVKHYEKGAAKRIGFALQTCIKPEIMVCDFGLGFGNNSFRAKCLAKLEEYARDDEVTFFLASYGSPLAKRLCKRGIVIDNGRLLFDGPIEEAIAFYRKNIVIRAKDNDFDEEESAEDSSSFDEGFDDSY